MMKISGFVDMEIDVDDIIPVLITKKHPEEVFPKESLEYWAEENGYIKESE